MDLASRLASEPVNVSVLDSNEPKLLKRYSSLGAWPADAQLALHLMAWAVGSGFSNPAFRAAVGQLVPDFRAASLTCAIPDRGHLGIISLNGFNRQLFANAAAVTDFDMKAHRVYYPMDLTRMLSIG